MSVAPANRSVVLLVAFLAPVASAGKEKPPPPLVRDYVHPAGAFAFKMPEGWTAATAPENPNAVEAGGGGVLVRFIYRDGEAGYDSLHVACMLERLAGPMETEPQVRYEYDFVGGAFGDLRGLDSAFVVTYDKPIGGHRKWRQRNVTVVGGGHSLCAISYAPAEVWKKSKATRSLLDAVLSSVRLR